jgi:hypothetical protein
MSRANQGQRFDPTEKDRELVSYLAAGGIPWEWIARAVVHPATGKPISKFTLQAKFKHELAEGGWVGKSKLVGHAFKMAMDGDRALTIFLLKVRMGWRETIDVNNTHTYAELVEAASKPKPDPAAGVALALVKGGKA